MREQKTSIESLLLLVGVWFAVLSTPMRAHAVLIGGVEFADGAISFVDEVVSFTPGPGVLAPFDDPSLAIGVPDWDPADNSGAVPLGDLGVLVMRFTDNSLTTSGDSDLDLWIFEVGIALETVAVSVSTNGVDWIDVGDSTGATSGIDIDAFIGSGILAGELYSYVRLTDLPPFFHGPPFSGADIDAIGASSSGPAIPEPSAALLIAVGLLARASRRFRSRRM